MIDLAIAFALLLGSIGFGFVGSVLFIVGHDTNPCFDNLVADALSVFRFVACLVLGAVSFFAAIASFLASLWFATRPFFG